MPSEGVDFRILLNLDTTTQFFLEVIELSYYFRTGTARNLKRETFDQRVLMRNPSTQFFNQFFYLI